MSARALAAIVPLLLAAAALASCGGGGDGDAEEAQATPARTAPTASVPAAAELIVVSEGETDELLLEWNGGPANATKWQYRQRRWENRKPLDWTSWTDIPGGASTRSYRVSGLSSKSSYEYELRAVVGTTAGTASGIARGGTQKEGGLPDIYLSAVVEGDGRRAWQVVDFTIVIPDGMRLVAGVPYVAAGGQSGSPVYVFGSSAGITFASNGSVIGRSVPPPADAGNAQQQAARDLGVLLDQIIASVRELP